MFLIEKNTITIDCKQKQIGNQLKDEVSLVLKHDFYPKLEKLLEKFDSKNTIWNIDFLTISLPKISHKNWKQEIVEESLIQIEKYLEENKPQSVKNGEEEINKESKNSSKIKYIQNLFFEYIKTGLLNPNSVSNKLEIIFKELFINDLIIKKLEKLFLEKPNLILRWSLNIPQKIKSDFLFKKDILFDFNIFKKIAKISNLTEYLNYLYWVNLFGCNAENLLTKRVVKLKKEAQNYYNIDEALFSELINELSNSELSKPMNKKISPVFKTFIREFVNANKKSIEEKFIKKINKKEEAKEINDEIQEIDIEKALAKKEKSTKKIDNTQYINNGGLILLHPFLLPLFRKLGYLEDKKPVFKNKQLQYRAVLISQYLLDFKTKIFENELLLNKILCGVAITEPIPTDWKITKQEKEQCEKLLESVIEHWKILKDTSVMVFQASFLKREAKITENKNNSYELIVEQKSIDILLDQLPWGLGMIKTPWMKNFITCYWN